MFDISTDEDDVDHVDEDEGDAQAEEEEEEVDEDDDEDEEAQKEAEAELQEGEELGGGESPSAADRSWQHIQDARHRGQVGKACES